MDGVGLIFGDGDVRVKILVRFTSFEARVTLHNDSGKGIGLEHTARECLSPSGLWKGD